jgi:hypothetical protein
VVRHPPQPDQARLLRHLWQPHRGTGLDQTIIGINTTALDDPADPDLVPVNLNRLADAAPWLAAVGEPKHACAG